MKKFLAIFLLVIFVLNFSITTYASNSIDEGVKKINKAGSDITRLMTTAAFWIVVVACILDCIKQVTSKTPKDALKTLLHHAVVYGSILAIPWLFRMMENILG